MQHPQPEATYPEFPPQPQSFHPHSHDFRQQEMSADRPVDPRSSQPAGRSINEGPVTEAAMLELLKAGKEAELHDLYANWATESGE